MMRPHRPDRAINLRTLAGAVVLTAVLTAASAACSDPAGLGDSSGIVGAFVLVDVGGEPLPVRGSIEGIDTETELRADTLRLDDRSWQRSRHIRSGSLEEGPFLGYRSDTSGFIRRLDDGRFRLDFECDDTGDCPPAEVFEARGDTLLIDRTADFLFEELRFARIGGSNGLAP